MVVVDVCESAWAGWPPERGREGFLWGSSSTRQNQQVGEVSANSLIAVKSVTRERIQHQQLGTSHSPFLLWKKYLCDGTRKMSVI